MTERPILFSAPMVRALLAGRKTQTRRILKPLATANLPTSPGNWKFECDANGYGGLVDRGDGWTSCTPLPRAPYGVPGDRLWVKETWARRLDEDAIKPTELVGDWAWYWADPQTANTGCAGAAGKKRPSIFMQRRFSRITLEIVEVRVQRLQDISEDDAKAEGIVSAPIPADEDGPSRIGYTLFPDDGRSLLQVSPVKTFSMLWDSINDERAPWSSNPWVWALTFKNISAEIAKR